jgi:HEAT repeat protein
MRVSVIPLLAVVVWVHSAAADEPRTFFGKTVDGWIAVLRDGTASQHDRLRAIRALGYFGSEAKPAAPDLIEALDQKPLQDAAISSLVLIGSGTERTVPLLVERFRKEGCQRFTGQGTFPYSPYVRDTLVRIGGPAVPALVELLNGPDADMRVCAAEAIGGIGPAARGAVPPLIRAIRRPDGEQGLELLAGYAIQALGCIGPDANAAVPALNALLGRTDRDNFEVVVALDRIGAPPVRKLRDDFLRTGDVSIGYELGWLGPKAREAAPALRELLVDKRPQVRFSAAAALAAVEPAASESIPVLIEALDHLNDRELEVDAAIWAVAHLGPRAKRAVPKLIDLILAGCDYTEVFRALVRIDPDGKECVPALISSLDHDDPAVVATAANCLGLLGPRARAAVPALAKVLARDFAARDGLDGPDPRVRAAKALERIGPHAKPAIPVLISALKRRAPVRNDDGQDIIEGNDYFVAAAALALGSFGPDAKAAVAPLIEVVRTELKDNANWQVRQSAIVALGRIGPEAKSAIPVLRSMANGDRKNDFFWRPKLLVALYQLDPASKALAERWLEEPSVSDRDGRYIERELEARAIVLGALGRTSPQTDWWTSMRLKHLDTALSDDDLHRTDPDINVEEWFEALAAFGTAARSAVPRLNELRKHPSPWVRVWATEALEHIMPSAPSAQSRVPQR